MVRTWKNVELKKELAGRFKEVCRDFHIKYETSECGNLIHFEVLVNLAEEGFLNNYLATLE